jgi:SAM-dependent methyltransferase
MSDITLRTTFNIDAERYHANRPNYPTALFDKLAIEARLPKQARLLEIGPGTGQATKPLAERGYQIMAVELGTDLAAKARQVLADYPNVAITTGAFEDVELPSEYYDMVYSATAIHWVKPELKFTKPHQLLKPGGYLAIIHTEHVSDEKGDAFFYASQSIYRKYHTKDKLNAKQDEFVPPRLADLRPPERIDESLFSQESFTVFPTTITYTSQEYIDLLATYSPHLALPGDKRAAFFQEIKYLIDKDFGGRMAKHYGMTLMLARK